VTASISFRQRDFENGAISPFLDRFDYVVSQRPEASVKESVNSHNSIPAMSCGFCLSEQCLMKWPQYLCRWRACALLRPVRAFVPTTVGLSVRTTLPPLWTLAGLPPRAVSSVTPSSLAAADSSVSRRAGPPFVLLAGRRGWLCFEWGIERRVCQLRRIGPIVSARLSVPPDCVPLLHCYIMVPVADGPSV
jgi:hypothetical protein